MLALVVGGARSGKSEVAERLAERLGDSRHSGAHGEPVVTYVATGAAGLGDQDFDARIARHRARRPEHWQTVEVAPGRPLSPSLASSGVVLVDSLGTWLAGHADYAADVDDLVAALEQRREGGLSAVLVSDEVGLGVHPETHAGLAFRDALGELNRRVAEMADEVRLVVAGRVLMLPAEDA